MSEAPSSFNVPGQSQGPLNLNNGNSYMTDQWIRRWELVVYDATAPKSPLAGPSAGQALVLSAGTDAPGEETLRARFEIKAPMIPTPNVAVIRIYNPQPATVMRMVNEFTRVSLSAGYLNGKFGTIFDGWITQFKFGGETSVDKFVELYAQDGDLSFNHTVISKVLMPGFNSPHSMGEAIVQEMYNLGLSQANISRLSVVPTARPVVIYGMAVDHLNTINKTSNTIWSIQNGKLVVIPASGAQTYSETLEVNALTGLIGFPTLTNDGLEFRTLLNPFATIGQFVKINNAEINQIVAGVGGGNLNGIGSSQNPQFGLNFFATPSDDNTYQIANVSFLGDTRGQEWYTDYIGITVDAKTGKLTAAQGLLPSTQVIVAEQSDTVPPGP